MKFDEVNWDTILEATSFVARTAYPIFLKKIGVTELQNECILFIHSFRPDSGLLLLKYATGERTDEKVSKLITALMRNKSWADPLLYHPTTVMQHKNVTKAEAITIIKKFVNDGDAVSEEESLIMNILRTRLNKKEQRILRDAFATNTKRKTVAAISAEHNVSERWIYKVKTKAIDVAMNENIPLHLTYRGVTERYKQNEAN